MVRLFEDELMAQYLLGQLRSSSPAWFNLGRQYLLGRFLLIADLDVTAEGSSAALLDGLHDAAVHRRQAT